MMVQCMIYFNNNTVMVVSTAAITVPAVPIIILL
jgi:hypothetical protein